MKKLILLTFVTVLASCTSNPTTEVAVKTDSLTIDSISVDTIVEKEISIDSIEIAKMDSIEIATGARD